MQRLLVVTVLVVSAASGCLGGDDDRADDADAAGPGPEAAPALSWTAMADAPTPRTEVQAGLLGDAAYVIGGFTGDGTAVASVEVYDPAADAWSAGPDFPYPVNHHAVVSTGDDLYVFGGLATIPGPLPVPAGGPSPLAWRLDGSMWTPVAPMPLPRAAHAAALVGDRIYVVGGYGAGFQHVAPVHVYDPAADSWTTAPDLPTLRDHLAATAMGDRLYVIAGDVGGHADNTDVVDVFDPATGEWSTAASLPVMRGSLQAVSFGARIVTLGGQNGTQTFGDVEAYDPATDGWTAWPSLPTPRHGFGVVVWSDRLYAFAGGPEPGLSVTGSVEALGPSG